MKWIGFDLDSTLAKTTQDFEYEPQVIGQPIMPMIDLLKRYLEKGWKVKIFTARAQDPKRVKRIGHWLQSLGIPKLQVTNVKDKDMQKLYDDKAVSVKKNKGSIMNANKKLQQVVKNIIQQLLSQRKKQRPKGQNIKRVLRTAKQSGREGASWTQLHNAILGKSPNSDRSSQKRGTNISRINRRAGRSNGRDSQGQKDNSKYSQKPLIKKNELGNYVITQAGVKKLIQLDKKLGEDNVSKKNRKE